MPDYLDGNMEVISQPAPALSATSDMPVVEQPAADPAPPTDPEPPAEPVVEPSEPAPAKEPRGVGKALKERDEMIAAERKRADDTAELLRKATEALARLSEKAPEPAKIEEIAPRPKREQFADPDAYEEALIEWSGNRAAAVAQKTLADAQAAADAEKAAAAKADADKTAREATEREWLDLRTQHMTRVEKAKADWPDYEEIAEADTVQITPNMAYTIMQLSNGPAIAYHLGKTPAEAERISKLPPAVQIAEIGRLSALVAGPRAAAPRREPPAPIVPLEANRGRADAAPSLSDMATEDYVAARLKEMGSGAATRH